MRWFALFRFSFIVWRFRLLNFCGFVYFHFKIPQFLQLRLNLHGSLSLQRDFYFPVNFICECLASFYLKILLGEFIFLTHVTISRTQVCVCTLMVHAGGARWWCTHTHLFFCMSYLNCHFFPFTRAHLILGSDTDSLFFGFFAHSITLPSHQLNWTKYLFWNKQLGFHFIVFGLANCFFWITFKYSMFWTWFHVCSYVWIGDDC